MTIPSRVATATHQRRDSLRRTTPRRPHPERERDRYAELLVTSNFSFLRGASRPDELVRRAAELGHEAIAISDRNSLAGIVRAHVAAKEAGIPLVIGARVEAGHGGTEEQGNGGRERHPLVASSLLLFPTDRASYGRLCRLLTLGKRRAEKGDCRLTLEDVIEHSEGLICAAIPPRRPGDEFARVLRLLRTAFDDDRLSLALGRTYRQDDEEHARRLAALARDAGVPLVAVNDVHYHAPDRRALQDVLTCIREKCTIEEAGLRLFANAERHLKSAEEMRRLLSDHPEALARTAEIARRCAGFSLDQLRYEYPDEVVPAGRTPMRHLIDLTWAGAAARYPAGVPDKVRTQIEHELRLIDELRYAPYFLTVHDLVAFAESRGILCQGRGAAANSAVCYCLRVTAVDPDRVNLLFERFISRERDEPPDIDIDFEHERREEVIQHIYRKYGRDRAALTAEVITYRGRSAIREVGKAMGLSLDCVDRLAKEVEWWNDTPGERSRLRELELDPDEPNLARTVALARELAGFPRHLSQHVGGFVITRSPLCELVPIENARMEDRTVIEWDKDDIDALGMLKVDVLGLGMLTCLRKGFELVEEATKRRSGEATEGGRGGRMEKRENGCGAGGKESRDGSGADISGSDRLAEGNGHVQKGLRGDVVDARFGTPRSDEPDASGGGFDPVEHRGSLDAVRTGLLNGPDPAGSGVARPHRRNGPGASGADQQSGTERHGGMSTSFSPAPPPSLPSLPFVASPLSLSSIPPEDPAVYDMLCRADSVGVFQVESRAQMSMLPRLKPRCYYDLVIQVAIVRPGPIQGDMVHPYLRRRAGEEPVVFFDKEVERVLGRTLGVPLFQEQAMALAVACAGFTPGQADQLRRAIGAWKTRGHQIESFGRRIIAGMIARGYPRGFAERCFEQIKGFSGYGFPESHAASFAHLVYASAWMKRYHPAAFAAALINSQPMGFYQPAQIVRDARDHGVEVRPVDVNHSAWDCTLEEATKRRGDGATKGKERRRGEPAGEYADEKPPLSESFRGVSEAADAPALRLGMRLVKGLAQAEAERIVEAVRHHGPVRSIEALRRASGARASSLRRLAQADAFGSMGLTRRRALWEVQALRDDALPLFDRAEHNDETAHARDEIAAATSAGANPASGESLWRPVMHPHANLPRSSASSEVDADYSAVGMSLRAHPLSFIRALLDARGVVRNVAIADPAARPTGRRTTVAGIVLVRQRPGTAGGIVFMTIEDETGVANLIVRPRVYERFRRAARHSRIILCSGVVERQGEVVHVLARSIESLDSLMPGVESASRDFH